MALNEKKLADTLIDWRQQQATGTLYVPIEDAITIADEALVGLQQHRATIARLAAAIEPLAAT